MKPRKEINMISKSKVRLQIPVKKSVAITWNNLIKESGCSQEEVFTSMFANLCKYLAEKGGEENAKNKDNKKA